MVGREKPNPIRDARRAYKASVLVDFITANEPTHPAAEMAVRLSRMEPTWWETIGDAAGVRLPVSPETVDLVVQSFRRRALFESPTRRAS